MRIMSNNTITREEITQTLSEMDAKQNKQIKYLTFAVIASTVLSVASLVFVILK
jgi:hypothetical protein